MMVLSRTHVAWAPRRTRNYLEDRLEIMKVTRSHRWPQRLLTYDLKLSWWYVETRVSHHVCYAQNDDRA
ncbi:hypothetical protein KCU89_g1, partial [Aureobasidium melanogenum]